MSNCVYFLILLYVVGNPKGACITHGNIVADTAAIVLCLVRGRHVSLGAIRNLSCLSFPD